METKLYLASAVLLVGAILLYKLLKYEQRSQEDEGGMIASVTIGFWSSIISCVVLSIILLFQGLMA